MAQFAHNLRYRHYRHTHTHTIVLTAKKRAEVPYQQGGHIFIQKVWVPCVRYQMEAFFLENKPVDIQFLPHAHFNRTDDIDTHIQ